MVFVRRMLLLFLLAFMPLIMRYHLVQFPPEVLKFFPVLPVQGDLFNWWRSATLCSVCGFLLLWKWRDLPFYKTCIFIYFAMVVASSILSNYPEVVLWGMPNYLEGTLAIGCYCVLFLTSATVVPTDKQLEWPIVFATLVTFIACALQYFSPQAFIDSTHWLIFGNHPEMQMSMETWPLFGLQMNQNMLGTFAAICYAFFLGRGRWFMVFLCVVTAVGCQSRGSWVAMVIATVYLAFKYRTWKMIVPITFFAIGIAIVYLHPTKGGFKWTMVSSGRIYVWQKTFSVLSPSVGLLGYGPGAFAMDFPQNDAKGKIANGWKPETVVDRPHNFYLQVLHASGGISLIALLALFGKFLLESKEIALNAAVLSYLVNVFFTDSCTSVAPIFWILLGTGVGRLKILNREKKKWLVSRFPILSGLRFL